MGGSGLQFPYGARKGWDSYIDTWKFFLLPHLPWKWSGGKRVYRDNFVWGHGICLIQFTAQMETMHVFPGLGVKLPQLTTGTVILGGGGGLNTVLCPLEDRGTGRGDPHIPHYRASDNVLSFFTLPVYRMSGGIPTPREGITHTFPTHTSPGSG